MSVAMILPFVIGLGVLLVLLLGLVGLFKAFYRKVDQGTALIVNDMSTQPKVHFTGALIIPVLYKAEVMQISLITMQIDRRGKEGLICRDNIRADIEVASSSASTRPEATCCKVAQGRRLRPRVGPAGDRRAVRREVLRGAEDGRQAVRLRRAVRTSATSSRTRSSRSSARTSTATCSKTWPSTTSSRRRSACWTSNNILDAEGIKKITELTAAQKIVATNELRAEREGRSRSKNVEAREAILALERQLAEAEAQAEARDRDHPAREEAETAQGAGRAAAALRAGAHRSARK